MPTTTRRQFLAATSAAALAAAASPAAREANSRIRVALIGLGGRANAHLQCLLDLAGDRTDPMVDLPHFQNFFRAVRSCRREELTAEIEEGHKSSVMCHLANIAYRLGRTLAFDPAKERFVSDAEADQLLTRTYREPFVVKAEV